MKDGKRQTAQKQVYQAFKLIAEQSGDDPLKIFVKAVENIKPQMEVRARRIGGAAYQVPTPVRGPRKESLAIRWIIAGANSRPATLKTYGAKLAAEILDGANGTGTAIAKKTDIERQAEANKAFSHFRW